MLTYLAAHKRVYRARGSAESYDCVHCGNPAQDWAYQNCAGSAELVNRYGRRYSPNPGDYDPLCKACHAAYDTHWVAGLEAVRAMMDSDPSFASRRSVAAQEAVNRRMKNDPEFRSRIHAVRSEGGSRGGKTGGPVSIKILHEKLAEDAEFAATVRSTWVANGKRTAALRYACDTCGRVMSPGNLGYHQKAQGHSGRTQV